MYKKGLISATFEVVLNLGLCTFMSRAIIISKYGVKFQCTVCDMMQTFNVDLDVPLPCPLFYAYGT